MFKLLINAFFIYMIVWWVVLFCILPINTSSYAEAGVEVTDGGDPGAPIDPKLKQKARTTAWVSAIVFAVGYAVYYFHLIPLPDLPTN